MGRVAAIGEAVRVQGLGLATEVLEDGVGIDTGRAGQGEDLLPPRLDAVGQGACTDLRDHKKRKKH